LSDNIKSIDFLINENKNLVNRIKELENFEYLYKNTKEEILRLNDSILSERKERVAIEERFKIYFEAFEQSSVTVMITNNNGIIEYVNPHFRLLTGFSQEEVIGKNSRIMKSGFQTEKFYKEMWETISSGKTWFGEFHNKKKNGESFWESATISPIFNSNGKITHFVAVKENITERKKSQSELRELNTTKDKLFSIIAHDLRSPFTALLGYSEFIVNEIEDMDTNEIKVFSQNINTIAKNVYSLLDNLLNWSRLQTGRFQIRCENIDVRKEVKSIFELFSENVKQKKINLNYLPKNDFYVYADKQTFLVIMRNFISNAIKFTNKNGKIDIDCKNNGEDIEISVNDSGIGIEKSSLKKLLHSENYFSTKGTENEEGSGLGFVLSKELITLNNGKIWVDSEIGIGSSFKFTLPSK